MNKYYCSDGTRISDAGAQARYSAALKEWYPTGYAMCEGCGARAIETSHIVSKARCKELKKTELIWTRENTFPSCRACHRAWEAVYGDDWKKLRGAKRWLKVEQKYDAEGYERRIQGR